MDHRVHYERCLEAHNFIFLQDIGLKIGTPDISGSLLLNRIKSYRHLKTEFLSGRIYICHILTTRCEAPSWSRSKNSPDL